MKNQHLKNLKFSLSTALSRICIICIRLQLNTISIIGTVNERGYKLKPENLRSLTIPIKHLSDLPVLRNWQKNCVKIIPKRITWPELPPMAVQNNGHRIQKETIDKNTALLLVWVLVTCCGRIIIGANLNFSGSSGILLFSY